jgi:alanine dehydrogenase
MDPLYLNNEKIASLLPMTECISVMERMFRALASGECLQPLRSLMWLPDKSGLLGMMPGFATGVGLTGTPGPGVMGIKVITIFPGNHGTGLPSHQGVVLLFDAKNGNPLLILDAAEVTAIRTAAASAVATRLLARADARRLAIIGSGEQAARHIESMLLVRPIRQIDLWSRNEHNATQLAETIAQKYSIPIKVHPHPEDAIKEADIICTTTASKEPVVQGDWIPKGAHINAVGSSTSAARELDTAAIRRSKLFTDCYESLFKEAGDFLIPQKEGAITNTAVQGEIGEVLIGKKKGREHDEEITLFKSLGIAAEDLFAAWHIYEKIAPGG